MALLVCGAIALVVAVLLAFVAVPRHRARPKSWEHRQKARVMCPWCLEKVSMSARTCEHCHRPVVQPSMSMTRR
jgi:hypothetical protein